MGLTVRYLVGGMSARTGGKVGALVFSSACALGAVIDYNDSDKRPDRGVDLDEMREAWRKILVDFLTPPVPITTEQE